MTSDSSHPTHEVRPEDVRTGPPPAADDGARARTSGPRHVRAAWLVAILADALQWVAFPVFASGGASAMNDVLDVAVAVFLVRLLGWHWAFLPTFLIELFPMVDLVPTWTLAVYIATRGGTRGRTEELTGR